MSRLLIAACLAVLAGPAKVDSVGSRTVSDQSATAAGRKYMLHFTTPGSRITRDTAAAFNAHTLAEYDTMIAVAVPEQARDAFLQHVATLGARAVALEDVILAPRATLSTVQKGEVPSGIDPGLFLVQYVAPATEDWQAAMRRSGVVIIGAIPERSALVAATVPQISEIRRLPWVQYVGPYEPAFKYEPAADPGHAEFTIQLAEVPISSDAVESIRRRVGGLFAETRHEGILTARFTADMATARSLLDEPFVIGVEAYSPMQSSDERQALSVTTVGPPSGSTTRYLAWLNAPGRDITPDKLTQSGIIVDIADTGVDNGCGGAGSRHLDLAGRTVYHNGATPIGGGPRAGSSLSPKFHDRVGHGTVIAGIAGGNPAIGINADLQPTAGHGMEDNDNGTFYYGLGVAPGIRFGNTVMMAGSQVGTVAEWTTLAVTQDCVSQSNPCPSVPSGVRCRATVQNHSNNEYTSNGSNAGAYTVYSEQFDISVRNADRLATPLNPLAITISAGNYKQDSADPTKAVMAPATAKNVITVGAAESRRTKSLLTGSCSDLVEYADGYDRIAYPSRRGTNDSRLKPDLVAPGSMALGPRAPLLPLSSRYCETVADLSKPSDPQYHGATGTSFAAPVAAGSIALLRYYYASRGLTPSPAMYKAMLVAGARSIAGGLDRLETVAQGSNQYVTGWPSAPQGFGIIMLSDLLSASPVKSWHDQSTVLLQGQQFQRTVTVADPTKPVRIVVAWTDKAAMAGAQVALVNDLQLTAQFPKFPFYLSANYTDGSGWSRTHAGCSTINTLPCFTTVNDGRNNVDVLNINPSRFTDPANRTFTVRVKAVTLNGVGVPGVSGGAYNQDFALFVMNGTLQ